VARSRRPPSSDVDLDDAEYYSGSEQLKDVGSPENQLFRDQLETVINQAILELPEDLRTAVTLREYEGLSYEDIAAIMDCPVGTIRSRIFRGRESIDARVVELIEGE
jgi:RNA polymerase sigma-70 factor (ECF subfamily)